MQYLWKPKKSLLEKVIKNLKAYLKRLHQGPKWHSKWNLFRKDRTSDREILKCLQAAVKQIQSKFFRDVSVKCGCTSATC